LRLMLLNAYGLSARLCAKRWAGLGGGCSTGTDVS
jgi:hypothetical protein